MTGCLPYIYDHFAVHIIRFFVRYYYVVRFFFNKEKLGSPAGAPAGRYLYACAADSRGKEFIRQVIEKFGHEDFDYLIFVYDDTRFDEEVFRQCRFIYEKGLKWQFCKKFLTPGFIAGYAYIFVWDDDIELLDFSYRDFIKIMRRNALDMAQPALSRDSYATHKITLARRGNKIGRLTDFVEIMVPVFTAEAWIKFWKMLGQDAGWGWGYDMVAKKALGFKMGIVDCQQVRHARASIKGRPFGLAEEAQTFRRYKDKRCWLVSYGSLK